MVLKVLCTKILFIKLNNSSKHSLMLAKPDIEVHLMYEFMPPEPFLIFYQRTCPIHHFRSKTRVFEGFAPFRRRTRPVAETRIGVHLIECCFFQNSRTLDILLERFQCTPLGPKLKFWVFSHHFDALKRQFGFTPHHLCLKLVFWVVSRHFIAAPDQLWKSVSGCI